MSKIKNQLEKIKSTDFNYMDKGEIAYTVVKDLLNIISEMNGEIDSLKEEVKCLKQINRHNSLYK